MVKYLFSSVLVIALSFNAIAQIPAGAWFGELKVNPQLSLKLVFHINDDNTATMDSPDQGAYGIPGIVNYIDSDSLCVSVASLAVTYTAHLSDGSLDGTFSQGGAKFPLTLQPGDGRANRPQTPKGPFAYNTEEVTITNGDVTLTGTLTTPSVVTKQTPLVVMITGSGQQNREEELFEHKPFAVIADWLARNGIASMRYDDRGVGGSTGDISNATTADFAVDAQNIINYLRYGLGYKHIGILGHSEGGLIAYKIGGTGMVDFIVSVAGPSLRGDSILIYQNLHSLAQNGIKGQLADEFAEALAKSFQLKIDNPTVNATDEMIWQIYPTADNNPTTRQLSQSLRKLLHPYGTTPWMQYFISYSPAADMQKLRIPALIIYGGLDTQVPAEINATKAREYAPEAIVKTYPYANHLMQHATTGNVSEYKEIEETFSPEILQDISDFIKNLYH